MKPESVNYTSDGDTHSEGLPMAVEGRLTAHRSDGSVVGSYDAETMDSLLHYHNLPEVGVASGAVVMAGEVVEG